MRIEPEYVQQIVNMYSAGIEQKEITEATGQTYCVVRYWLKKKGLYDPKRRQHVLEPAHKAIKVNEERKREAETRLARSLLEKGFTYIEGYNGKNSHIKVSCLTCGVSFTKYVESVSKLKTISCPICAENKRETRQAEKDAQHKKWEQQQEEYKQKRLERELELKNRTDEVHICKECGCIYTYRSYAQSIGVDPIFIQRIDCCSKECLKKHKHKQRGHETDHIKRAVRHGCEWESGVTLKKLIKRDGLRCAICGELCDINDKSYGNGNGPLYPSMDHIIPIAKGGSHTWNNVQVAHLICNTLKSDKVI